MSYVQCRDNHDQSADFASFPKYIKLIPVHRNCVVKSQKRSFRFPNHSQV